MFSTCFDDVFRGNNGDIPYDAAHVVNAGSDGARFGCERAGLNGMAGSPSLPGSTLSSWTPPNFPVGYVCWYPSYSWVSLSLPGPLHTSLQDMFVGIRVIPGSPSLPGSTLSSWTPPHFPAGYVWTMYPFMS